MDATVQCCTGCGRPVQSPFVSADGNVWHTPCFIEYCHDKELRREASQVALLSSFSEYNGKEDTRLSLPIFGHRNIDK